MPPMIQSQDLSEHLSRTPLHITLGLGANYLDHIEAELIHLDRQWASTSVSFDEIVVWQDAMQAETQLDTELENLQQELNSVQALFELFLENSTPPSRGGG